MERNRLQKLRRCCIKKILYKYMILLEKIIKLKEELKLLKEQNAARPNNTYVSPGK